MAGANAFEGCRRLCWRQDPLFQVSGQRPGIGGLVTYESEDAIQEYRVRWPRSGSSSRGVRRQRKEAGVGKEHEVDVTQTIQIATSMATTCLVHPWYSQLVYCSPSWCESSKTYQWAMRATTWTLVAFCVMHAS